MKPTYRKSWAANLLNYVSWPFPVDTSCIWPQMRPWSSYCCLLFLCGDVWFRMIRVLQSPILKLNTVEPLLSYLLGGVTIRSDNRKAEITGLNGVGRVDLRVIIEN